MHGRIFHGCIHCFSIFSYSIWSKVVFRSLYLQSKNASVLIRSVSITNGICGMYFPLVSSLCWSHNAINIFSKEKQIKTVTSYMWTCTETCGPNEFSCSRTREECIPFNRVCDLKPDCLEGEDEVHCDGRCHTDSPVMEQDMHLN